VSVPKDLVAVMSAVRDGQEVDPQDSSRIIYRFRQPVAMPSYLIAIVVGALESREIGPRSRVWSEKEFVDKAAIEFSEYDILVLPPSFPYGGMENPCLTFATPTLLVNLNTLCSPVAASSDPPVDQLFPVSLLRLEINRCLE
ncbi:Leukotriene A-4 hydrolase, partial [Goodea atripinnis]